MLNCGQGVRLGLLDDAASVAVPCALAAPVAWRWFLRACIQGSSVAVRLDYALLV